MRDLGSAPHPCFIRGASVASESVRRRPLSRRAELHEALGCPVRQSGCGLAELVPPVVRGALSAAVAAQGAGRDGHRAEDGGRRAEDGGRSPKMGDGRWEMGAEGGGRRAEDGGRRGAGRGAQNSAPPAPSSHLPTPISHLLSPLSEPRAPSSELRTEKVAASGWICAMVRPRLRRCCS